MLIHDNSPSEIAPDIRFRGCVAIRRRNPFLPVMPAEEAVSQLLQKAFGLNRHSGESRNLL
jgi:hypothetical protein